MITSSSSQKKKKHVVQYCFFNQSAPKCSSQYKQNTTHYFSSGNLLFFRNSPIGLWNWQLCVDWENTVDWGVPLVCLLPSMRANQLHTTTKKYSNKGLMSTQLPQKLLLILFLHGMWRKLLSGSFPLLCMFPREKNWHLSLIFVQMGIY